MGEDSALDFEHLCEMVGVHTSVLVHPLGGAALEKNPMFHFSKAGAAVGNDVRAENISMSTSGVSFSDANINI